MTERQTAEILCHDCGEEKWAERHAAEHPDFCIFVPPPPSGPYAEGHSPFCDRSCDHPCHEPYDQWAERYRGWNRGRSGDAS